MAEPATTKAERELNLIKWTKALAIATVLLAVASFISDIIVGKDVIDKNATEKNVEQQLRAFFVIRNIDVGRGYNPQLKQFGTAIVINALNIGSTRAVKVSGFASIHYYEHEIPNNVDVSQPFDKLPIMPETVIGPQSPFPFAPIGISNDDVVSASAGQGAILVWGRIDYATIYDQKTMHHLPFCFLMTPAFSRDSLTALPPAAQINNPFRGDPYRADCNLPD